MCGDCDRCSGHGDAILLALLYNSGARTSELASVRVLAMPC